MSAFIDAWREARFASRAVVIALVSFEAGLLVGMAVDK